MGIAMKYPEIQIKIDDRLPMTEGIDHININIASPSKIGHLLAPYVRTPFSHKSSDIVFATCESFFLYNRYKDHLDEHTLGKIINSSDSELIKLKSQLYKSKWVYNPPKNNRVRDTKYVLENVILAKYYAKILIDINTNKFSTNDIELPVVSYITKSRYNGGTGAGIYTDTHEFKQLSWVAATLNSKSSEMRDIYDNNVENISALKMYVLNELSHYCRGLTFYANDMKTKSTIVDIVSKIIA